MTTTPWHAVVYIVRNVFYKAEPNAIRFMLKERAVQVSNVEVITLSGPATLLAAATPAAQNPRFQGPGLSVPCDAECGPAARLPSVRRRACGQTPAPAGGWPGGTGQGGCTRPVEKVVWISYIPGYGAALIRWKWVVLPAPWPGQVHPAMTLGLTATS